MNGSAQRFGEQLSAEAEAEDWYPLLECPLEQQQLLLKKVQVVVRGHGSTEQNEPTDVVQSRQWFASPGIEQSPRQTMLDEGIRNPPGRSVIHLLDYRHVLTRRHHEQSA